MDKPHGSGFAAQGAPGDMVQVKQPESSGSEEIFCKKIPFFASRIRSQLAGRPKPTRTCGFLLVYPVIRSEQKAKAPVIQIKCQYDSELSLRLKN